MLLLKVSIPSLSHMGSDPHALQLSDDHITEKRNKDSEKRAAGGMQGVGGGKEDFPKWVTDKTDALSFCSSVPCPTRHCCSPFLPSPLPQRSRRLWDLLCSNWGTEMVIFFKKKFFKSILGCAYVANSTALVLSKGRNSPQFNKYEKNPRQIKKISHWGNTFHISSPAQKAASFLDSSACSCALDWLFWTGLNKGTIEPLPDQRS